MISLREHGGGGQMLVEDGAQCADDVGRLDHSGEPVAVQTEFKVEADKG